MSDEPDPTETPKVVGEVTTVVTVPVTDPLTPTPPTISVVPTVRTPLTRRSAFVKFVRSTAVTLSGLVGAFIVFQTRDDAANAVATEVMQRALEVAAWIAGGSIAKDAIETAVVLALMDESRTEV